MEKRLCFEGGEAAFIRQGALIFHVVFCGLASPTQHGCLCINRLSERETSGGSQSSGTHLAMHANKAKIFPPPEESISRPDIHKQFTPARRRQKERDEATVKVCFYTVN